MQFLSLGPNRRQAKTSNAVDRRTRTAIWIVYKGVNLGYYYKNICRRTLVIGDSPPAKPYVNLPFLVECSTGP